MKILLSLLMSVCCTELFGQNYVEYQKTFNRIDNDILSNNLSIASKRLDTIYHSFDFIYAKHCIKALQISCLQNDTSDVDKWLKKCFIQGVPFWIIRNNEITSKVFQYPQTKNTLLSYDSLRTIYNSSLNIQISRTIDSLYVLDQKYTNKVNNGFILFRHTIYGILWLNNNRRQFNVIKDIIDQYGFPGEKLIGLSQYYQDSIEAKKDVLFYGPSIDDYRAYIMLIHYFSSPRDDINEALITSVRQGFLPAYQYGAINDFNVLYGKKKNSSEFYNVWHDDPNIENNPQINSRRQLIGLSPILEQNRNNQISTDRRKSKTINSEIILE